MLRGAEHALRESKDATLLMDIDVTCPEEKEQLFQLLLSYGFHIYRIGKRLELVQKPNQVSKDILSTKGDLPGD